MPQRHTIITTIITISLLAVLGLSCADPNCKSCPTNFNLCESCKVGYYFNETCSPCGPVIDSCTVCSFVDNAVKCSKCSNGFAVNTSSNVCSYCLEAMPNCGKCAVDSQNSSKLVCTECNYLSVMD